MNSDRKVHESSYTEADQIEADISWWFEHAYHTRYTQTSPSEALHYARTVAEQHIPPGVRGEFLDDSLEFRVITLAGGVRP